MSTKSFLERKKGQGLVEYGIILVLVAVAAIGVFAIFGNTIKDKIAQVTAAITGDTTSYKKAKLAAEHKGERAADMTDVDTGMEGADLPDFDKPATGEETPPSTEN
jgi:Flp pilus assembly pilin Flp